MTANLLEKLRKSRETNIDAGGFTFTIRRLTDFDIADIMQNGGALNTKTLIKKAVVGWPGMTELKLGIPGGSDIAVEFDSDLFAEWVAEYNEVWQALRDAVWQNYAARKSEVAETLGKPEAG